MNNDWNYRNHTQINSEYFYNGWHIYRKGLIAILFADGLRDTTPTEQEIHINIPNWATIKEGSKYVYSTFGAPRYSPNVRIGINSNDLTIYRYNNSTNVNLVDHFAYFVDK